MIVVVCDVSKMYLQIRIPPEDCPNLRFLWRKMEVDQQPDIYEFERVTFDVASAHFRAEYVSQENARIHQKKFPIAFATVIKLTYMDDSLDSVRESPTVIQLVQDQSYRICGRKLECKQENG